MSEKQTENKVDELFRKGIEPLNTEPSDEFWRKAAEHIIRTGKTANSGNNSRWRALVFILAASLLLLGYFTIKLQSGFNKATLQIESANGKNLKKEQLVSEKTKNTNSPVNTYKNNDRINQTMVNPTKHTNSNIKIMAYSNKNNRLKKFRTPKIRSAYLANASENKQVRKSLPVNSKATQNKPYKDKALQALGIKENTSTEPTDSNQNSTNTNLLEATRPAIASTSNLFNKTNVPNPTRTFASDSLKKTPKIDTFINSYPFTISAYFSPNILTGYNFKSNDNAGSKYETAVKTGEKERFSYNAGVNTEYKLTNNLSVGIGLAYQSFSFETSPSVIYAQKQSDGQIGYSIITSSGVVNCPYYGPTSIGDSLKMTARSSRTYLSIPVQFKYFVIKTAGFGVFIAGGVAINISTGAETIMNWEDYWNYKGTSEVSSVEGLQSIYYSYTVGLGASYTISRHIGLYAEPTIQGSLSAINKNTPVISYPYLLGLNIGATYQF